MALEDFAEKWGLFIFEQLERKGVHFIDKEKLTTVYNLADVKELDIFFKLSDFEKSDKIQKVRCDIFKEFANKIYEHTIDDYIICCYLPTSSYYPYEGYLFVKDNFKITFMHGTSLFKTDSAIWVRFYYLDK